MLLVLLLLVIIAVIGYLVYKKQISLPITECPLYKNIMVQVNKIKEQKQSHPKTGETKSNKPVEGTHVPKPKGDEPVIEDRPNGKKEVVSGDKSILIDRIRSKYYDPVSKKYEEVGKLADAYGKAKNENAPNKNEIYEKFQAVKKEAEEMKIKAAFDCFKEINIYIVEEDVIDMHGLEVEGAVDVVKQQIEERKKQGKKILKIQCGMGHHNTVGYSKIKEAVVEYCKQSGLKFTEDKEHGFVNVDL